MDPSRAPGSKALVTDSRIRPPRRGIAAWVLAGGVMLLTLSGLVTSDVPATGHDATSPPTLQRQSTLTAETTHLGVSWLNEVNRYRLSAGLGPVNDQPAWDAGLQAHFTYLQNTPAIFRTGPYQSAHTENPASPYFTSIGALEAASSDLAEGATGADPVRLIDAWLTAPFHAVGLLRPGLQHVAFAYDPTSGDAGIDVINGLTGSATTEPILFPGPGMTTNLTSFGGELPDPLDTCGWNGSSAGLPLIAMLPEAPSSALKARLAGPSGSASSDVGDLCIVDQYTYRSSDPVYGPAGLDILQGDRVVVLVPRSTLTGGTYTATIDQPGSAPVSWSFQVDPPLVGPVTGIAATPDGGGYWLVSSDGGVSIHGDASYFGSMAGQHLNSPISHLVPTSDGGGYWLVAADGGIFAFGDAPFFGSMGGRHLNAPVVALVPTVDCGGYWLVAADGGVFALGDAPFLGSMGGKPLNRPVVDIAADNATGGYWLIASDGGVFAFGAPFLGSTGDLTLARPVNGMAPSPDGNGYLFVASDGGVFTFGDAVFFGSMGGSPPAVPVVGITVDSSTGGYWLADASGAVYAFGAPFLGSA